jgi:general L-amino acid transport system permease protein
MAVEAPRHEAPPRGGSLLDLLYEPRSRGIIFQVLLALAILWLGYEIVSNTIDNLKRQNTASGFDFLGRTAGFDISQSLIAYSNTMSYGRAFVVGLLNTILVAVLGIVFATILGFMVGIGRLSSNWLIAKLSTAFVEIVRNVPLLLQLFIWYFAVLKALPAPRNSLDLPLGAYLNVRGLYMPAPEWQPGAGVAAWALLLAIVLAILVHRWAKRRQLATGQQFPSILAGLGLVVGLPVLAFVGMGLPVTFSHPELKGFNYTGGMVVQPEFVALLVGLSIYTASFIAEVVRSGILGVTKGQKEAAAALGLRPGLAMRLVVIPQAMRIIIPPLTNQYLNLTKNSSLAVAIGYPDLVSVFAGTVLNQTNQAVECILITMGVYLALSLLTSLLMNWFNARMALVER